MTDSQQQRMATAVKSAAGWTALMVMIFLLAGRLDYWQGWLFGALNLLILVFLILFFPEMPSIMRERAKPGPDTKSWDRIFWGFFGPMNLVVFVLAILDGGRFQWTKSIPVVITGSAAVLYILAGALHFSAIKTNIFYSSTVSIHRPICRWHTAECIQRKDLHAWI